MIDPRYAARQVGAVWNMAWNRPGWAGELDRSVDGVFRSFAAMLYVAPLLALNFAAARIAARAAPETASDAAVSAPLAQFIPAQMMGAYADWCLTLVILGALARAVGASRQAAELFAGYNWLQIPSAALQSIPAAALLLPGGERGAAILILPIVAVLFAMFWGYLRRALSLDPAWTFLLVILLTLAGLVIQSTVSGLAFAVFALF
jgi:hypothetical protein